MSFDPIAKEWDAFRRNPSSALCFFLPHAKGRVLDAGCGNGRNALALSLVATRVDAVDLSEEMVKRAQKNVHDRKNVHVLMADFRQLPFENETFDAAFCLAALHHLPPEEQPEALLEFHRVLKKGGRLCLTVWNGQQPRFWGKNKVQNVPWHGQPRYYYFFEQSELHRLLKKAGFTVEKTFFEKNGLERDGRHGQNLCAIAQKTHQPR